MTELDKRYARVVVRAADAKDLGAFLSSRALDVGGRPHKVREGWVTEFYLPADECAELSAKGCEFEVDHSFFERLQQARLNEEKSRLSDEDLKALLKKGLFPGEAWDGTRNPKAGN